MMPSTHTSAQPSFSNFPAETWSHIFHFLSTQDDATDSSPDAWAKIVTSSPKFDHRPSRIVIENNEAKRALGLVCRDFYGLSRPVVLETISLWTSTSLAYLALQIEKRPELAQVVGRFTKRLDCKFDFTAFDFESEQRLVKDFEHIFKSCHKLVFLRQPGVSWSTPCLTTSDHPLLEVVKASSNHDLARSLHTNTELRVLDLSEFQVEGNGEYPPSLLPCLHTTIGSLGTICTYFEEAQLPSLRTLVFSREWHVNADYLPFFRKHGKNIESLDVSCRHRFFNCALPQFVPNVKELVVDLRNDTVIDSTWAYLQRLGFVGLAYSDGDLVAEAELVLRRLETLESRKESGHYPCLQTVRILDDEIVQHLRGQNRRATRLWERRLRALSISLEDGHGNSLISSS